MKVGLTVKINAILFPHKVKNQDFVLSIFSSRLSKITHTDLFFFIFDYFYACFLL